MEWETEIVNDGGEDATVNYKIKLKKNLGSSVLLVSMALCSMGKLTKLTVTPHEKRDRFKQPKGDFANWTDGTVCYENQRKIVTTQMNADTSFGVVLVCCRIHLQQVVLLALISMERLRNTR